MKHFTKNTLLAAAAVALTLFQSCDSNDMDYDYSLMFPNAIVTVKPVTDGEKEYFYLQLNDEEKLWPEDNSYHPYKDKEVRAFVNFTETEMPAGVEGYSKAVKVNWLDSILTKRTVLFEEDENITVSQKYGNDPVEIYKDYWTNVEDGYLTLHFYTRWGNSGISHELNLVTGLNPEDPYEVRFTHNAHGDGTYYEGDGIVAFRLQDLPDTKGETVKLTLKYDSFDREKTFEFDYCTREDWSSGGDTSSDGE